MPGWRRALVIGEGYWLTAGRYGIWQNAGAQTIWMKRQQNGFASPSLSFSLRTAEREWLRKYASAYSKRHCVIHTGEHKQSWADCLKRKMLFLCFHRPHCPHKHSFSPRKKTISLFLFPITVPGKVILHSEFISHSSGWAGQKIRGTSVKNLKWRNAHHYALILKSGKRELQLFWDGLIMSLSIFSKVLLLYSCLSTFFHPTCVYESLLLHAAVIRHLWSTKERDLRLLSVILF